MKIYHVLQTVLLALPKEKEGTRRHFNICYATTKEMALDAARRRIWREAVLSRYRDETFHPSGGKIVSGPLTEYRKDTDLKAFCEVLEFKIEELRVRMATDLNATASLRIIEADTDRKVEDPDEAAFGQPLPVRKEDLDGDLYAIEKDRDGVKHIHILGYFYSDGEDWTDVECSGLRLPLKEFVENYAKDEEYPEHLFEACKQYQSDYYGFDHAAQVYRNYFGGYAPDAKIPYGSLTEDTPEGNYIS